MSPQQAANRLPRVIGTTISLGSAINHFLHFSLIGLLVLFISLLRMFCFVFSFFPLSLIFLLYAFFFNFCERYYFPRLFFFNYSKRCFSCTRVLFHNFETLFHYIHILVPPIATIRFMDANILFHLALFGFLS
jgi:hypothetical protein